MTTYPVSLRGVNGVPLGRSWPQRAARRRECAVYDVPSMRQRVSPGYRRTCRIPSCSRCRTEACDAR